MKNKLVSVWWSTHRGIRHDFKIIVKLRSFLNKCVPRFKIMYALFVLITKHSNQTVRVRFGSYESYDQNLTQ